MATFEQIFQQLRQGKYSPVYFLYGDEAYFIDSITDYLAKNVLTEAEQGFNLTILYGLDTNSQQILESAKRYPMMSERQVVIVKEAQNLRPAEIEKLQGYMENPVATTILALASKGKKPDKRKKIFKLIAKNGILFESKPVYDNKLPTWIETYVHHYDRKISPKAVFLVSEYIGSNLSNLSNELNKVMLSVKVGETITEVHIADNIGISKDFNIFELQKALVERNLAKAMNIAIHFGHNQKQHPLIVTLGLIGKFYMNLMLLYFQPGISDSELASKIGINPYFARDYTTAKRNYTAAEVANNVALVRAYDLKSKGITAGNQDQGELLKELIFQLINRE